MSDVFLSYSREDKERAARFARLLEDAGLEVWWDIDIPPGQTWDQVIGKALEEAKCVVVLWTETSVASDWVKEEASRGARRGALVPVLLDEVEAPLGFGRIEAAELAGWRGDPEDPELQNFLAAVQARVEKPLELPTTHVGERRFARKGLLVAGLALVLAAAGWGIWKVRPTAEAGPATEVAIQLWTVETDRKGAIEAATSFSVAGPEPDATEVREMVHWILGHVAPTEEVEPVQVHLVIPADPKSDLIRIESPSEVELRTYLYVTADGGKSRVRSQLRPEDLAFIDTEFAIEIGAIGYDSIPIPVVLGEAQDRRLELRPIPVRLAVEELTGRTNRFAVRLTEGLATAERVQVMGPEALEELRAEIERSRNEIGVSRAAQVAIRDSLGVDFIVGGSIGSP